MTAIYSTDPALSAAAASVGCVIDEESFLTYLLAPELKELVRAAAGLFITTDDFIEGDRVMGPIFASEDETSRAHKTAIRAEGDQIRAGCRDALTRLKPRLLAMGIFTERP